MKKTGLSLFWRCFITYIICTIVFLCAEIYTYQKTSDLWQESYTNQISEAFTDNARGFSSDLFSSFDFTQALQSSDYFNTLTIQNSFDKPQDSYYASRIMGNIASLKSLMSLSDEVLVCMKRSGFVLTSSRVYDNLEQCFSSYYQYAAKSPMSVLGTDQLAPSRLHMLPADEVSIKSGNPSSYITCILSNTTYNSIYFFLIPVKRVLNAFQIDSLPDNTQFCLMNSNGDTVYSTQPDSSIEYVELSAPVSCINGTAILRIPIAFFSNVTAQSLHGILLVLGFSLILGLVLCFIFSHVNTKPVQQLIKSQQIPSEEFSRNELVTLYNYMSHSREQHSQLREQLLSNLLIRAFSDATIKDEEVSSILGNSELFRSPVQIAILRYRVPPAESNEQSLFVYPFKSILPETFLIEPLNQQEIGLVFPADDVSISVLRQKLTDINDGIPESRQIICGISLPFVGPEGISSAARQALYSLPNQNEILSVFSEQGFVLPAHPDMPEFKDFQIALSNWNMSEVNRLLSVFSNVVRKENNSYAQQVFYTLLAFIKDVAADNMISTDLFDECTFAKSISSAANILAIQKLTDYLFEQKIEMKNHEKEIQERDILNYIRDHIDNPGLSPTYITNYFGRSERSVNTLILSLTGMSFSTYLLNLRMQRAGELLRESNQEVIVIAEQCGLALSTFYRNFKRYYHMTPADYKEHYSGCPASSDSVQISSHTTPDIDL